MVDEYIKTLDFGSIEKNKGQIIESFVALYGEDRREEITEKISKVEIIPYMSIDSLKTTLKTIRELKTKEELDKLKEKIDPELSEKFFDKYDLDQSLIFEYYKYVDKVKETNDRDARLPLNLVLIDKTIDAEAILDNNPTDMMKIMDDLRPYISELHDDYDKTLDKLKVYQEMLDKVEVKENELKDKYMFELATKYKDFLGEEYDKIVQAYNKGKLEFINHPKFDLLTGRKFTYSTELDYFDQKSEDSIKNKNVDYYKDRRIMFFKKMGIDLGDDYEVYENDERCKQIKPSVEFVEQLKKDREEINNKFMKEVYLSFPIYTSVIETVKKHQPLGEMNEYETFFSGGATALCPNVKRGENGLESMSFVFINMDRSKEPNKLDMAIFHELNHVVEYKPLSITEESYEGITGWDAFKSYYVWYDDSEKRGYELFSEIINDLLAEKAARDFHSKGNSIVSDPKTAKYSVCGYRSTQFLVNEFFEKFYEPIVASRSGNFEVILEAVGRENFEELNSLFSEYNDNLGGLKLLQYITDREKGQETDLTRKYDEIIRRRDEVLARMEEYSKTPMVM